MTINRREWLAAGTMVSAGFMTGAVSAVASDTAENPAKKGVFKLSSQEGVIPGKSLTERLDKMEKWGFAGIEFGGGGLAKRVEEIQKALSGRSIKISAICSGYDGVLISEDPAIRKKCIESIKEILVAAGALGSTGLIMVPAFNGQTKLGHVEGRKVLLEVLRELSEPAQKAGTRILLEPLNRGEAWFLRQLADAAAICKDAKHPAICQMGDFYHMGIEEPCDYAAFLAARNYVHHVHLASRPTRVMPGLDKKNLKDDFRPGFKALKTIGYQDFCSLECSIEGKPEIDIPKGAQFLKQQWEECDSWTL